MVASKNKLPEDLQVKLAQDPNFSVRRSIAFNKKATLQALRVLLDEENDELKRHVLARIADGRHK